jgi:hypothetical protein
LAQDKEKIMKAVSVLHAIPIVPIGQPFSVRMLKANKGNSTDAVMKVIEQSRRNLIGLGNVAIRAAFDAIDTTTQL